MTAVLGTTADVNARALATLRLRGDVASEREWKDDALRLAIVLASRSSRLDPRDLAAVALAFPARGRAWAEEASEAAVRHAMPRLVMGNGARASDPTRAPFGASSWSAVHRRVHVAETERRLGIAADVACHVDESGALWTWGVDRFGCLGDGGESDDDDRDAARSRAARGSANDARAPRRRCTPRRVRLSGTRGEGTGSEAEGRRERLPRFAPPLRVSAVAIGGAHVVAADDRGGCWTWGRGINGQLGRVVVPRRRPDRFDRHDHDAAEEEDAVYDPRPTRVPGFGGNDTASSEAGSDGAFAVVVAAGSMHTAVVDAAGAAWTWGLNTTGQLGLATPSCYRPGGGGSLPALARTPQRLDHLAARVVSVAAGRHRTLFLDESGAVHNAFSNLLSVGAGALTSYDDAAALTAENPAVVVGIPPVVHVSMTWEHALMVDRDGRVWCWGNGGNGRTGLGHERAATSPVGPLRKGALEPDDALAARCVAGKEHSLVLMRDGSLVGFGRGAGGALPTAAGPGDENDRLAPVAVTALERVRAGRRGGGRGALGLGSGASRVACGAVEPGRLSPALNACAAVSAADGRVYTWGHPRPWLGRGGDAADGGDVWAPGSEPAAVRFDAV